MQNYYFYFNFLNTLDTKIETIINVEDLMKFMDLFQHNPILKKNR